MTELATLAGLSYPECQDLLDGVGSLTVWGSAYRYPAAEDIPEPVPDEVELRRAFDLIERLVERLQAATAPGNSPTPQQ